MIDPRTKELIIETANIVDVIGEYVRLQRRGANYLGLCPFHNEKTPSFTVSPQKGIFKCFGCGESGNVASFIMKYESVSFPESLRILAKKYNIAIEERELTDEEQEERKERDALFIVNEFAQQYFRDILKNNHEGKAIAMPYFQERGIRPDTIEHFELGYCSSATNDLATKAIALGYKKEFLVKLGLVSDASERLYDKYRGRIIFPIFNLSGKVIGFGGRILKKNDKQPKYINSPESEVYSKGKNLYGLNWAKKAVLKKDKCYLVEGYTDVIGFYQGGVDNVVASLGTALTQPQIRLIHRFTKNLTIVYDGDAAGIKAALRGIDMVLEEGMNVKIVLLPEGDDPDSLSQRLSSSELLAYLNENEEDFIRFKASLLKQEAGDDPVKRASLINDVVETISVIPDAITRSLYVKDTSKILDVEESLLKDALNKLHYKKRTKRSYSQYEQPEEQSAEERQEQPLLNNDNEVAELQEKEIIRLLLRYGEKTIVHENQKYKVSDFIISGLLEDEMTKQFKNAVCNQIIYEYKDGQTDTKYFINHSDDAVRELVVPLLFDGPKISRLYIVGAQKEMSAEDLEEKLQQTSVEELNLADLVMKAVVHYKITILELMRDKKVEEMAVLEREEPDNDRKQNSLMGEIAFLSRVIVDISNKYGFLK